MSCPAKRQLPRDGRAVLNEVPANVCAGGAEKESAKQRRQQSELQQLAADMRRDAEHHAAYPRLWASGHYRLVLGIPQTSRTRDIYSALRRRIRVWHPGTQARLAAECREAGVECENWADAAERVHATFVGLRKAFEKKLQELQDGAAAHGNQPAAAAAPQQHAHAKAPHHRDGRQRDGASAGAEEQRAEPAAARERERRHEQRGNGERGVAGAREQRAEPRERRQDQRAEGGSAGAAGVREQRAEPAAGRERRHEQRAEAERAGAREQRAEAERAGAREQRVEPAAGRERRHEQRGAGAMERQASDGSESVRSRQRRDPAADAPAGRQRAVAAAPAAPTANDARRRRRGSAPSAPPTPPPSPPARPARQRRRPAAAAAAPPPQRPNPNGYQQLLPGGGGGIESARKRSSSAPPAHHSVVSGVVFSPVVGVPLENDPRGIEWPEATLWNCAYAGDAKTVKQMVKQRPQLVNQLGYLKTRAGGAPVRLGLRKFSPGGSPWHVVLPAPPGDDSRATALQFAIAGGRKEVVHVLLKLGAKQEVPCQQGSSARQVACQPPRDGMLTILDKAAKKARRPPGLLNRIARLFD